MNIVVPNSKSVIAEALKLAEQITINSPDAVQSTKHGILLSQKMDHSQVVHSHVRSKQSDRVYKGKNIKEGLKAFAEVGLSLFVHLIPAILMLACLAEETRTCVDESCKAMKGQQQTISHLVMCGNFPPEHDLLTFRVGLANL